MSGFDPAIGQTAMLHSQLHSLTERLGALVNLLQDQAAERPRPEGEKSCTRCGAMTRSDVASLDRHSDWHERTGT